MGPRPIWCASLLLLCACSGGEPTTPSAPSPERGLALAKRKCVVCHQIEGRGGILAPTLEAGVSKVKAFLPDYAARVEALARQHPGLAQKNQAVFDRILAEPDPDRRFALYLDAYLVDPQFDDPQNKMTPPMLRSEEIADVKAWLEQWPAER